MYLSVDGGGSKLRMLLADESFNLIQTVELGGVNVNFMPAEPVQAAFVEAVERCVPQGAVIRRACCSILCKGEYLTDPLNRRARVEIYDWLGEGEMGLLAGVGCRQGFAALSGTGSHAVFLDGTGRKATVGGLGMLLGDEGSGYDIGQRGLKTAVQAHDGRGEPTLLLGLLAERWGIPRENLPWLLFRKVSDAPSPRVVIASFASVVSEAACRGDAVAVRIYEQAGHDMARHMIALSAKLPEADQPMALYPAVICGGAWKGSRHMFRVFRNEVQARLPGMRIVWPAFDAVVGGLVQAALASGMDTAVAMGKLKESCSFYIYNKPADWRAADDE